MAWLLTTVNIPRVKNEQTRQDVKNPRFDGENSSNFKSLGKSMPTATAVAAEHRGETGALGREPQGKPPPWEGSAS